MTRHASVLVVVCLISSVLVGAQQPAGEAARDLPIRRVVLYKAGVGLFEHVGPVTGSERLTIPFTSPQLDDVLRTLTVVDLDGGQVSSVRYSSDAPLNRRLSAFGLPLDAATTMTEFLSAMRGARIEVRRGTSSTAGRLLEVQQRTRETNGQVATVDQISLVTAAGEVLTFDLGSGTTVRFADPGMIQRLNSYLETVASARDRNRRSLAIDAAGTGTRRLYVSYVSEVPVWKTTYRIVLPDNPKDSARLHGWAIVDNTVGDDWTNVELSLVAGAPQSFVQAISQPLYTRRPQVPMPGGLLLSPQTHAATLADYSRVSATVVDSAGGALPGVAVRVFDERGTLVGSAVTDAQGRISVPASPGRMRVEAALAGFTTAQSLIETGTETRLVMTPGGVQESVSVASQAARVQSGRVGGVGGGTGRGGMTAGVVGGVPAVPPPPMPSAAAAMGSVESQATARDLGEMFEYKLKQPVTVRQNQSAMVPIVSSPLSVERVSLWNRSDAGARPRRALWVTNTSGLTLDGGSVAIMDGGAFGGEGLVETIKPNERRLVSYAADLGMQVEVEPEATPTARTRVLVSRGVLTTETFECQRVRYTARNLDETPRQLVVEQARPHGWQLVDGATKPAEATVDAYRFQLPVAARATAALVVTTYRPVKSSFRLADSPELDLDTYLTAFNLDPESRRALEPVIAARRELLDQRQRHQAIFHEIETIKNGQARVRENMQALKGSSEEKQLLQRYVRQLSEQEDRLIALQASLAAAEREVEAKQLAFVQIAESTMSEAGPLGQPCS